MTIEQNVTISPDEILYDWDVSKMLEVSFNGDLEAFPKIRETLTRIGIASSGTKTLTQSCNILKKGGTVENPRYYIVHFKEIFYLNGKSSTLNLGDVAKRNRIADLLQSWNLCKIIHPEFYQNMSPMSDLKIVKASEKHLWNLVAKQQLGTASSSFNKKNNQKNSGQ